MQIYRLESRSGVAVSFIPTGGAIIAIEVPDRTGTLANVVLAHRDLGTYRTQKSYLGAVCGRYANRIAGAHFTLDGRRHVLNATDGISSVHGGRVGFDKAEWAVVTKRASGQSATLSHTSPDGDEGYPGTLAVTMTYTLGSDGTFEIAYEATTDRPTVVSLTNHSYFNLSGEGSGDILGHVLEIPAGIFTPSDADLIPTGELAVVADTPFDFTVATPIGDRLRSGHPQMLAARGYDVNYVINGSTGGPPKPAARVFDPASGRSLEVATTAPGMQFYSGNNLDGTLVGPRGQSYRQSDAFCLEPHHYPNTPNMTDFPSARLNPGEVYRSRTRYRFGTIGLFN